ncbi:hypothetical protein B0H13DRAFT_2287676 [Mycena leptocephala]|nr:hypothetical protein B0H13DRAFT_2287676 [Mycena leptocephala]
MVLYGRRARRESWAGEASPWTVEELDIILQRWCSGQLGTAQLVQGEGKRFVRVGDSACATGIVWNEEGTEWIASEKRGKCCAAAWQMLQRAPDWSRAGWGEDERVVILESWRCKVLDCCALELAPFAARVQTQENGENLTWHGNAPKSANTCISTNRGAPQVRHDKKNTEEREKQMAALDDAPEDSLSLEPPQVKPILETSGSKKATEIEDGCPQQQRDETSAATVLNVRNQDKAKTRAKYPMWRTHNARKKIKAVHQKGSKHNIQDCSRHSRFIRYGSAAPEPCPASSPLNSVRIQWDSRDVQKTGNSTRSFEKEGGKEFSSVGIQRVLTVRSSNVVAEDGDGERESARPVKPTSEIIGAGHLVLSHHLHFTKPNVWTRSSSGI